MAVHVVVVIVAVVGAVSPSTVHVAVVLVAVIGAVSPSIVHMPALRLGYVLSWILSLRSTFCGRAAILTTSRTECNISRALLA